MKRSSEAILLRQILIEVKYLGPKSNLSVKLSETFCFLRGMFVFIARVGILGVRVCANLLISSSTLPGLGRGSGTTTANSRTFTPTFPSLFITLPKLATQIVAESEAWLDHVRG